LHRLRPLAECRSDTPAARQAQAAQASAEAAAAEAGTVAEEGSTSAHPMTASPRKFTVVHIGPGCDAAGARAKVLAALNIKARLDTASSGSGQE